MTHFQDSRFLGLSGRAILVTFVLILLVVGLFFIPETVKYVLNSGRTGDGKKVAAREAKSIQKVGQDDGSERGALSSDVLKAISASVESKPTPARSANAPAGRKEDFELGEKRGLFSGWNIRVKARGNGTTSTEILSDMGLDKFGTKEFIGLMKDNKKLVDTFMKKKLSSNTAAQEVVLFFNDQIQLAAAEKAKGMPTQDLLAGLQELHVSTIQALSQAGVDRGVILDWLKLPIVEFVDTRAGVNATQKVRDYFYPRLTLRSLSVRQRRMGGWGGDGRSPATLTAELAFKGSDIERVVVFLNGRKVSQSRGGSGAKNDDQIVKVRGDAQGVYTFVAYDRFGGQPYWKSYSFYPRVIGFPQNGKGEFMISFSPKSAPNSLDRFFLIGTSALRQQLDPMIGVF